MNRTANATARTWTWTALALALAACARHEPAPPAPPTSTAPTAASAMTPGAAGAGAQAGLDAGVSVAWAEAVRLERWDEAQRALDGLSDAEKDKPEVRYVRARVALARGAPADAAKLLDGLEASLPLLSDDIAHHRAEARLIAGPFDQAAEWFAARTAPVAQLKAARAFVKVDGASARARAAADRVVLHEKRTRAQEAEARMIRARLGGPDAAVAADARWIRVRAPESPFDKEAGELLAKADPSHPLTAEETMARGRALADAGRTNDALAAFEHAASAPGKPVAPIERLRAKAEALFKSRGRYAEAAAAYALASRGGGPRAAEDAFDAARALARADRDDEAIRDYEAVTAKWPRTTWAEQAIYHAARLHLLHARWREAASAFDVYAHRYPSGSERKEATRNGAIAHLMAGDYKLARRLFGQIADDDGGLGSARAATMEALAALKEGDRTHAMARWTEVARSHPLTWPALVARARLRAMGAPLPAMIEPPDASPAPPPLAPLLPPPADLLHRIGLDADAEDAVRERESVITQAAPGRGTEALCAVYGRLGRAKRRFQVSLAIQSATFDRAPSPRTRWAWECAYPMPYEPHARAEEAADHLPEGLVFAVMRQESSFDPDAVSPARAVGLLQLMPETAKAVAEGAHLPAHDDARLTSPPYNITLGSLYMRELLGRFHGAIPLAVGGYNGGPDAIARWASRAPGMDLDVFVERIPFTETRLYVGRVMGNLARYGYLRHGDAGVPELTLAMPSL